MTARGSPTITVRLPKPERDALTALCAQRNLTTTQAVRAALAAFLGPLLTNRGRVG